MREPSEEPQSAQVMSGVVPRGDGAGTIGPFARGDVVAGAYEVRHVLGAGGMGVVYDALDLGLRRRVALKAALAPIYAEALRAEAHALAALRSPSFAMVYALASHEGTELLVMERLYGERLDLRIEAATACGTHVEVREAVDALIGIAKALDTAHHAGIAQRDVKPSNTIVMGERVVLFDFGLAVPEVLHDPQSLLSGSVEYLAPELITGADERGGGPAIDLYALGVVAYELLTGQTPFASDLAELTLTRHVTEPPPDVRSVRSEVPNELAALINELLAKDPHERPASAEAVLWTLETVRTRCIAHAHRSMNVLAVGDLRTTRALKRRLEAAFPRVDVEVSSDPGRALPAPERATPDLVLLDLDLPPRECVETCKKLRALPPSQRPAVVGMAARPTASERALLESLGVRDIVPKDIELLAAMTVVVGRFRHASFVP